MNSQRLYDIVQSSTRVFRKGKMVEQKQIGNVDLIEIFGYEHTSKSPSGDNFDKIDMIFVDVIVDKAKAEEYRKELIQELRSYPQPERLAGGSSYISYIELAPNLGMEQEGALRLMALGKTLGMWDIIDAKKLGMDETTAREMAGRGFLMISGYNPTK